MGRFAGGIVVVLVLAGACPAEEHFNVDFVVGWGGCYRPMEWTPIEIGIGSNLTKPFGGMITVTAQQDDLTKMTVGRRFVLTPDVPLPLPLVTKLAFASDKCELRIADDRGKTRWRYDYELWDFSPSKRPLTAVRREDMLIGLIGRRSFGLGNLPKTASTNTQMGRGKVYVKDKLPRMAPWDWTGFASLDILVLYDPNWEMLNAHQCKAIRQWVANGGKLLVVPGRNRLPSGHSIARLLPVVPGREKQVSIPSRTANAWGLDADVDQSVVCRPLKQRSSAAGGCKMVSYGTEETLFAHGPVGFGHVGVLAFDPSALKTGRKAKTAMFWVEHLGAILGDQSDQTEYRRLQLSGSGSGSRSYSPDYYYELGQANEGLNRVFEHLLDIPEMRPLSIWWVILLLTTLAFLLGPVDYFVLKLLDRQPLTWVTSAACILLFTVGAYYGVQALRSGTAQVRVVSVLDGVEGAGAGWSTTYMGVFAPESDEYRLENLKPNQWWSGISPSETNLWAQHGGRGTKRIFCSQRDGGNLPVSIPINIWSMQCMMSESPREKLPISAKVERLGKELLVSVTNRSDRPISSVYVRLADNRVIRFTGVPAGQTRQFRGRSHMRQRWDNCLVGSRGRRFGPTSGGRFTTDATYFARGCLRRTHAILRYLRRGAVVVCAEYDQAPVPFGLADRRYETDHVQLVRLVVFPTEGTAK